MDTTVFNGTYWQRQDPNTSRGNYGYRDGMRFEKVSQREAVRMISHILRRKAISSTEGGAVSL